MSQNVVLLHIFNPTMIPVALGTVEKLYFKLKKKKPLRLSTKQKYSIYIKFANFDFTQSAELLWICWMKYFIIIYINIISQTDINILLLNKRFF